jgi:CRP/FNR family transcriptional regulator
MINKIDAELIKNALSFWDKLDLTTQDYILQNTFSTEYKKKDFLNPGDKDCYGIILVKTGSLRVYILSDEGKEITLYRLEEGELCVLSSSCVLNSISFDVHLCAESNCELFHISAPIFQKIENSWK